MFNSSVSISTATPESHTPPTAVQLIHGKGFRESEEVQAQHSCGHSASLCEECPICLEEYDGVDQDYSMLLDTTTTAYTTTNNNYNDKVVNDKKSSGRSSLHVTACNHKFHLQCILEWQTRSQTCPTCQTPLPPIQDPTVPVTSTANTTAHAPPTTINTTTNSSNLNTHWMSPKVLQFVTITGVPATDASRFLELTDDDVSAAVTLYFATNP